MNDYTYTLTSRSSLITELKTMIDTAPPDLWKIMLEQNLLVVPIELIHQDPSLRTITNKFDPNKRICIFRLFPNTCYTWHADRDRGACINMLIEGRDSITFFGKEDAPHIHSELMLCEYPEHKYVLMNASQKHTVYNFDNMRYMLSISIPKPATYSEVRQFLIDENL
jgi:hypothetical protein